MLVGILSGDSVAQLYALSRNAPLPLINPLIIYLSHPEEEVEPDLIQCVRSKSVPTTLRPVLYRHLFNHSTGGREYVAGFSLPEGSETRRLAYGVRAPRGDFVPYARLCVDGMRSTATRAFCRSYANALTNYQLDFTLAWADQNDPEHESLFQEFNPDAGLELEFTQAVGSGVADR